MFASPTSVVATSLRALGGRVVVIPGVLNKAFVWSMRLMPRALSRWFLGHLMQRFSAGR